MGGGVVEETISGDSELMIVESILFESVMLYGLEGSILLVVMLLVELYCRLVNN